MPGLFKQPKRKLKKLVKDGEYDDAIAFGKSLEPDYSDDADFMFIMGSIYFIVDDAKKALPYFEKSFQLNSDDIDDDAFIQGIQFLIKEGIMKVPQPRQNTSSGAPPPGLFG